MAPERRSELSRPPRAVSMPLTGRSPTPSRGIRPRPMCEGHSERYGTVVTRSCESPPLRVLRRYSREATLAVLPRGVVEGPPPGRPGHRPPRSALPRPAPPDPRPRGARPRGDSVRGHCGLSAVGGRVALLAALRQSLDLSAVRGTGSPVRTLRDGTLACSRARNLPGNVARAVCP